MSINKTEVKGKIIADRFKVVDKIGEGGQGTVYKVHDTVNDNKEAALKILKRKYLPKDIKRMKNEAEVLSGINSDNIIKIISTNLDKSDEDDFKSEPYIVMEYARYGTLREHNYFNGEIDFSLKLFKKICQGVSDLHNKDVIHRDIKPSNILLVNDEKDIKVGDLGLCFINLENESERAAEISKIREKVGAIYFAAPEQTSLPPTYTMKSDIYSLGRILHYMITGEYAFKPTDEYLPVSVSLGLQNTHPVDNLIKKMISFDPKDRPNSIDNVISEIDELLGNKKTELDFKPTKMHMRIIKFVKSDGISPATTVDILHYVANFYDIDHDYNLLTAGLLGSPKISWSTFAVKVETCLNQLENAGFLMFSRGNYSITDKLKS